VRRALNYAVDVSAILEHIFGGRGRLAAGVIPPSLDGADTTRAPYGYDPEKAKELLAAAGYAQGFEVELWHGTDETQARIAQSIQAYLGQVGVRVKIVQRDNNAAREAARKGETDMILKDWYADYPDAENFLYPLLHGANRGVGGNVSFYENAAFDSIVSRARRTSDDSTRFQLYESADSLAFRDAPMIFLFFYNELYAVQPWIEGFEGPVIFNGQRFIHVGIQGSAGRAN
jgi:peptide/nickel transport system substrate-binding protein/oligopeptide transport system substrate-binding protein